jgi:hypothetical protein
MTSCLRSQPPVNWIFCCFDLRPRHRLPCRGDYSDEVSNSRPFRPRSCLSCASEDARNLVGDRLAPRALRAKQTAAFALSARRSEAATAPSPAVYQPRDLNLIGRLRAPVRSVSCCLRPGPAPHVKSRAGATRCAPRKGGGTKKKVTGRVIAQWRCSQRRPVGCEALRALPPQRQ